MRLPLLILLLLPILCAAEEASPRITEGYVTNGEHSLFYKTMGSGDPIVVVHGGPGFDHRQFLPFIWELAKEHQVILYDQRCTGLSTGPVDSVSINIDTFIGDIEAVRQAFGLQRMNLLGHSWGGVLAMYYGTRHQDRLKSLILCSTAATMESLSAMRDVYEANREPGDLERLEDLYQSEGYQSGDPDAVGDFWRVFFKPYFADQSQVEKMDLVFTRNTIKNSQAVAGYVLNSVGNFDLRADLKNLHCPTLIVHGSADPLDVKCAEEIHEIIGGSKLVIVEGAGHWLFVDGTDPFATGILDFLADISRK